MNLNTFRRWIIFFAALVAAAAVSSVQGQTPRVERPDGAGKVRLLSVRQGASATANRGLIRAASQWTDEVTRVRQHLQQGADPDAADDSGNVALSLAAQRDGRRVVRELYRAGAHLEGSVFAQSDGLHYAARLAQPEIVATLLASGSDPNAYDAEGFTPLLRVAFHEAAFPFVPAHASVYLTVAELLLAAGADPELPKRQETPGVRVLHPTIGPYDVSGATPLSIAAGNCADGLVMSLVRHGANVATPGAMSMPPLMHAAQRGCEDAVRILLAAKARPDQTGHQGVTAIVMAAMQTEYGVEHVRIVEMLLRAGASRDAARTRLKGRLQDSHYRKYPLHGRTSAEKILRLLSA